MKKILNQSYLQKLCWVVLASLGSMSAYAHPLDGDSIETLEGSYVKVPREINIPPGVIEIVMQDGKRVTRTTYGRPTCTLYLKQASASDRTLVPQSLKIANASFDLDGNWMNILGHSTVHYVTCDTGHFALGDAPKITSVGVMRSALESSGLGLSFASPQRIMGQIQ